VLSFAASIRFSQELCAKLWMTVENQSRHVENGPRAGQFPTIPFYKRRCQEKNFPFDWKSSRHPAPYCDEAL
jgi:hypothetical protein